MPDQQRRGPHGVRGEVRTRILTSAREEFIDHGYDDATMRAIARRAGCDSAMVSYYFGSKQRLFRESFDLPSDPAEEILALLLPGPQGAAHRIMDYAMVLYEERLTADTMQALMRALITDATTSRRFRTYIRTDVLDKVSAFLGGGKDFDEQIELSLAMVYGVAVMRYLVRLEPLASMPRDRIVAEVAPVIQARIDALVHASGYSQG